MYDERHRELADSDPGGPGALQPRGPRPAAPVNPDSGESPADEPSSTEPSWVGPSSTEPPHSAATTRAAAPQPSEPATPDPGVPEPEPLELAWRVPAGLTAMKFVGVLVFAGMAGLLARNPEGLLISLIAAAAAGAYAMRDLLAPVRLRVSGEGLTVISGYASARRISWSDVERIRVDARQRLGLRSQLLEIDAGDSLHLFSGAELGASVEDVADALRRFRTGR